MNRDTSIETLKGIGEKTAGLYNKVGIYSYGDLMYYYPRDYMSYDEPVIADEKLLGCFCFVKVILEKHPLLRRAGKMAVVTAELSSGRNPLRCVWFHMPYLTKSLKKGMSYIFGGTLKKNGNVYHMEQPLIFTPLDYEKVKNTLQPVYPLTKGLSNNAVRKAVKQVLDMADTDTMIGSASEKEILTGIHFPKDAEELKRSRSAIVYDEFLMFIIRLRLLKEENSRSYNDFDIKPSDSVRKMIDSLPYELTNAQKKAFADVESDLQRNVSMSRLIQGDVGCGKTIIAVLACITTALCGYQCAMMVPTEILALQHFQTFTKILEENDIDITVVLLTGSMKLSEKKRAYKTIAENSSCIVIGTHALFQEKAEYRSLALVVTDEQHRFGVKQRGRLVDKGNDNIPHVLVMSATPIPRTLAIMLYGDLDISVIDELPARRKPIKNCVVGTSYRRKAYNFIEKEIEEGHQAYVICPLVDESEGLDCKNVTSYTEELKSFLDASIRVGCLHGRMKPAEKERIMQDFSERNIDVLVSTTVVEVGVNVPNATVMMVENSERFGLAQLHQLRGRIGRGDAQSYCIFINCSESERSQKRLEILNSSNDGFYIANEDLKLRGPGDMFGIRQSGELQFKLADIYSDSDILAKAANKAGEILKKDPRLESEENRYIRIRLDEMSKKSDIHAL